MTVDTRIRPMGLEDMGRDVDLRHPAGIVFRQLARKVATSSGATMLIGTPVPCSNPPVL